MEHQDDINNIESITRAIGKTANWMIWSWCSTNFHHTIPATLPMNIYYDCFNRMQRC